MIQASCKQPDSLACNGKTTINIRDVDLEDLISDEEKSDNEMEEENWNHLRLIFLYRKNKKKICQHNNGMGDLFLLSKD